MRHIVALLVLVLSGCATTGDAGGFPARLGGLGTEPFWSIALDGDQLQYSAPGMPARSSRVTRQVARGTLELSGTLGGQPVRASIRSERCSDGMSDRSYRYAVDLTIDGRRLMGCAFAGTTPPE